ncbi:polysaccharide pyruvyl transferase family protein [Halomonas sp. H33-56]|uniref:polysaccharide pyruvyl transferase family protein n=1 Tax=Halomonas sp. H33-56 TaxID=2950873 RepID=UPI0032DF9AE9
MKKIIKYIFEWITKPERHGKKIGRPVVINFPITDNCNSRCVMCNVWKDSVKGELSPEEIFKILSNEYYERVEHLGISGGEPTLRSDLAKCVVSILEALPKLKTLSITSHGFHTSKWRRLGRLIDAECKKRGVDFSVNISLDGVQKTHDAIRGVPGVFSKVESTIGVLQEKGVRLQLQCTVSKDNIYNVTETLRYARDKRVEIVFRCATEINRLYNKDVIPEVFLDFEQRSYLSDFFRSYELNKQTRSLSRKLYYEAMSKWLVNGGKRPMPCAFQREGVLITSLGEAYACSVSDEMLANVRYSDSSLELEKSNVINKRKIFNAEKCTSCIHDQSGAWDPLTLILFKLKSHGKIVNILDVVKKMFSSIFLIYTVLYHSVSSKIINKVRASTIVKSSSSYVSSVLVVGAYGGEHVGDAAILGGVILRTIEKNPGIKRVYVSSFRPDRTKVWVGKLSLPVDIEVINESERWRFLRSVDMVVYGGGPLMELPLHLLKHFSTLYVAKKRRGLFCTLEGVGIGPLKTKLSSHIVKKMLGLCDSVVVRTEASADFCKNNNQPYILKSDPAFDYLEYRRKSLVSTKSDENKIVVKDSMISVAINLRPLWAKYSFSPSKNLEELQKEYIVELSQFLKMFYDENNGNVNFSFFPMNADQYGMSDFDVAYDLRDEMGHLGMKLNIWHEEPGVDEAMEFLRKQDLVVAMRFHACIFALSINKNNVISLDYQVGKDGKVTDVMRAHSENLDGIFRIDNLESSKLLEAANAMV